MTYCVWQGFWFRLNTKKLMVNPFGICTDSFKIIKSLKRMCTALTAT